MNTEDLIREYVRTHKVAARDSKRARSDIESKGVASVTSLANKRRQQG